MGLLVCATAAAPVSAELLPGADSVVARYVKATGGDSALAAQRSVRLKGRIESSGLTGRWEMTMAAPDLWVRRIVLGPLRLREGFDGQVSWRTDLSEKSVTVQTEAEARHAREEGWFLNEQWALQDQGGGTVKPRSTSYGDAGIQDVMEITPPGGTPRILSIGRKAGFVTRVTGERDNRSFEERPAQYRLLAGRKRWTLDEAPTYFRTDQPIERMTVDSAWVNEPLDPAHFSPPSLSGRAIAWQKSRDTVRAPFFYTSKTVLVRVSIQGAPPEDFILDTGASLTLLDYDYALQLKLQLEGESSVQGVAASAGIRFARVHSIALPGRRATAATLRDFRVAVIDMGEHSDALMWRKPVGILGADFLSHFAVELDYDAQMLTLHDPASFRYAGRGAALPFETFHGIPVVDLTLNGNCAGKFIVDVGNAFYFTVHGSRVRPCRMLATTSRKEVEVAGSGAGGGFVGTLCRLDSLRIGPFAWEQPVAALTLNTNGLIGSEDIAGNIGNTFLQRFKVTFDYGRNVLYLEPGRTFHERDRVSRFGALFARIGRRVFAGNVLTGSAAYDAGLRWYDEIIAVDDKPLDRWSREDVDRLLEAGEAG
ncbi:MAG: aspartyl protease family protein, partial [Candidatus Eisenbacteria bacterium]